MLAKTLTFAPLASLFGLYTYAVTYCANWPSGGGVFYQLHYHARSAAHALRQFTAEMNAGAPLGFTWFLVAALPLGAAND